MKICDCCGHRNFSVTMNAKEKRVCEECHRPMDDYAQNHPMNGHPDGEGCFHKQKIIDSDNIIDIGKKGN